MVQCLSIGGGALLDSLLKVSRSMEREVGLSVLLFQGTFEHFFYTVIAPCGLRGCKNGPAPFPGRMSYKATKPGLVFVLYLSMFIIVFGVY